MKSIYLSNLDSGTSDFVLFYTNSGESLVIWKYKIINPFDKVLITLSPRNGYYVMLVGVRMEIVWNIWYVVIVAASNVYPNSITARREAIDILGVVLPSGSLKPMDQW